MRVVYVLGVHRRADQVERLIRRLATERARFYVMSDRKSGSAFAEDVRRRTSDLAAVEHLASHETFWGGFGLLRTALKGIERTLEAVSDFDYVGYLSGQDYPLRSAGEIERFLAASDGRSYLSHFPLPFAGWGASGGLDRIERLHLVGHHPPLHLRLPWKRRIPGGLVSYGGGAWWFLARSAVEHVGAVVRERPELVRFFKHVLIPEELFFQTVLLNSPLAATLADDHLHHIVWAGEGRPRTLTSADFDDLVRSDKLFARKFDVEVDATILDRLDAHSEGRALAASG